MKLVNSDKNPNKYFKSLISITLKINIYLRLNIIAEKTIPSVKPPPKIKEYSNLKDTKIIKISYFKALIKYYEYCIQSSINIIPNLKQQKNLFE